MASDKEEFIDFIHAEHEAMEKSMWIESEKVKKDLHYDREGRESEQFYIGWIKKYSRSYRIRWDSSCCKICSIRHDCIDKWKCKKTCPNFTQEET